MVSTYSIILCSRIVNTDGKITLQDVLHTLTASSFPTSDLTFELFMLAVRDNGPKNRLSVHISPPDVTADVLMLGEVEVDTAPGELAVLSCRLGCRFGAPGPYFFNVSCGGELLGQAKLMLKQVGPEAGGTPT